MRPDDCHGAEEEQKPMDKHEQQLREHFAECIREGRDPREEFEEFKHAYSEWRTPMNTGNLLEEIECAPERIRLKPRTIEIAGIEVPEPMRRPPELGSTYYIPDAGHLVSRLDWQQDAIDVRLLAAGCAHRTRDAAIAHRRALIIASGGDPDA